MAPGSTASKVRGGNLHVLGRKDRQLKIRGVRVEPEEVEAAILTFRRGGEAGALASRAAVIGTATELVAFIQPVRIDTTHKFDIVFCWLWPFSAISEKSELAVLTIFG